MAAAQYQLDIDAELPTSALIKRRMTELGIRMPELAKRMGYESSLEKGVRQLNEVLSGDLGLCSSLQDTMARALELPASALAAAIEDARYVHWARDDRGYRESFRPHAVWRCEHKLPVTTRSSLSGATGAPYFRTQGENPARWSDQAASECPETLAGYGHVLGFWMNYSPDCAVEFNRQGVPLALLDKAVRVGRLDTMVKGVSLI